MSHVPLCLHAISKPIDCTGEAPQSAPLLRSFAAPPGRPEAGPARVGATVLALSNADAGGGGPTGG